MLRLICEFDERAREAIENYADINAVLSCSCKEKIGRAKYITEDNLAEFDAISGIINTELKALARGEGDV